jgi:hypothetical protein
VSGETLRRALPLLLLLALFGLLVGSVREKSPTLDEQNHIARGLAYLSTGDLRLSQEHPPGVNAWQAWPLLLDPRIDLPLEDPSWANAEWYGFADRLLWNSSAPVGAVIFAARVPVMWLTLILAALVARWARELGGAWAGVLAMALLVLDPNVLAHGRLATNDVGLACATVAACYSLWRALRSPTWKWWAVAGSALGLAQLAKFSALLLLPTAALLLALAALTRRPAPPLTGGSRGRAPSPPPTGGDRVGVAHALLALLSAGAVVWAGYRFTWGPIAAAGVLPGPAPAYWDGIAAILRRTGGGTPAFLMGEVSEEGWWAYFPVAFALKTPLPTLIALAGALGLWAWRVLWPRTAGARQASWRDALPLLLPAASFWAAAVGGSFNIGYRHILPSLPLLYVAAAWGWASIGAKLRLLRAAGAAALVLWLGVGTLVQAPHYLAYFNLLAGGPGQGYRYLVDSNLDWGQDLSGLARYAREHGLERIYLAWFGAAHPEAYDLSFHPLPGYWRFRGEAPAYGYNPYAPAPGVYAISATVLQGVPLADRDTYAWFRARQPDAQVGHSILIYDLRGRPDPAGAVVLGVPMSGLAERERELLRAGAAVRRYDPDSGILYPLATDPERTWFAAPEAVAGGESLQAGPGYVAFQIPWQAGLPRAFGPGFRFVSAVDYSVVLLPEEGAVAVQVGWWVQEPPHRAAVSFAHLLDGEGRYLAGWDGLTAPATCWQRQDLIHQQYRIPIPADLPPGAYRIEVGWYDATSGARWPCTIRGEPAGDRWLLPDPVEVGP